ncbi:hypothetical protein [Aquibacillus rhizosphaerae]|uniref:Uncharacterized protein n=1 Tax=Aquibacillus rhizosphaerae TaxID=3051431 RepID=A0ABT7L0X1_9BACI|nr:hypothetical protein [Aquibacillus sp. LR5S19]MDL4839486.1 hypothetical protein [Aquibacillus sp. LR5S19]
MNKRVVYVQGFNVRGRDFLANPRFNMKKIWTDVDFFEVNLCLYGSGCNVDLDIYLDNGYLEDLENGLKNFTNQLGKNEFTWVSGHEYENTTHFLSMRFFLHEQRGIVGIEFIIDNKLEPPYSMHSNFYILTEINQVDDLARKLGKFIKDEIIELGSLK